jgi:hypothetical protein
MPLASKALAGVCLGGCVLVAAREAAADVASVKPNEDATFGRISGDVSVIVGAGGLALFRALRATGELRARYLDTVGVFATYEETVIAEAADVGRAATWGLELRPLFLYRWLQGHETGKARLDLAIDSLGLEMGAVLQPSAPPGVSSWGFLVGLGFEVPMELAENGPWLGVHGGMRWSDAALAGTSDKSLQGSTAYVAVTVAWHQVFTGHVVDSGDRTAAP